MPADAWLYSQQSVYGGKCRRGPPLPLHPASARALRFGLTTTPRPRDGGVQASPQRGGRPFMLLCTRSGMQATERDGCASHPLALQLSVSDQQEASEGAGSNSRCASPLRAGLDWTGLAGPCHRQGRVCGPGACRPALVQGVQGVAFLCLWAACCTHMCGGVGASVCGGRGSVCVRAWGPMPGSFCSATHRQPAG